FFFSSRRRHTRFDCDWSSDVCSSDLDILTDRSRLAENAAPASAGTAILQPRSENRAQCPVQAGQRLAPPEVLVAVDGATGVPMRSEERRVGKEWGGGWGAASEK